MCFFLQRAWAFTTHFLYSFIFHESCHSQVDPPSSQPSRTTAPELSNVTCVPCILWPHAQPAVKPSIQSWQTRSLRSRTRLQKATTLLRGVEQVYGRRRVSTQSRRKCIGLIVDRRCNILWKVLPVTALRKTKTFNICYCVHVCLAGTYSCHRRRAVRKCDGPNLPLPAWIAYVGVISVGKCV